MLIDDPTAEYTPEDDPGEATLVLPQERADQVPSFAGETAIERARHDPPERIGPYRIVRLLGRGGMGLVYEAVHETFIRRHVALKVAKSDVPDVTRTMQRFKLEAALLSRLSHPHIVCLYDTGITELGKPYYVMERVTGSSLRRHCDRLKLTVPQRLELYAELCEVVHFVNGRGIVHRNVNPHNAMVTTIGTRLGIKLIDFGIAKPLFTDDALDPPPEEQGQLIGSLAYMSPEQALGELSVDARTDVYALGVVLYEMLTGRRPIELEWQQTRVSELVSRIIHHRVPPPSGLYSHPDQHSNEAADMRRSTPRKLATLIRGDLDDVALRCLQKAPGKRFATAGEIAERIRALKPSRRWWTLG